MSVVIFRGAALAAVASIGLAACAPQQSASVYGSNQALSASRVEYGTITGSRQVELRDIGQGDEILGALAGGVLGAVVGQQVGGGTGKVIATGVGATAGAAAGQRAGKYVGRAQSYEWFVRTDNGNEISVVQGEPTFSVGQRVRIVSDGGQTRLVP